MPWRRRGRSVGVDNSLCSALVWQIAETPAQPAVTPAQEGEAMVEGEEDLSPAERRVLERKMKKILKKEEKKRLKDEVKTEQKSEPSAPMAPQQALEYLTW